MKKMILLLLILSLLFCGCYAGYSRRSAGASGFDEEITLFAARVPYYSGSMDLRLDHITLLETDSYGRSLFHYGLSVSKQGALFVVQKVEEPLVYYYEDIFYIVRDDGNEIDRFQDADKIWLKEQNDWNQPLNETKMQSVDSGYVEESNRLNIRYLSEVRDSLKFYFESQNPEWNGNLDTIHEQGLEKYPKYGQIIVVTILLPSTVPREWVHSLVPSIVPRERVHYLVLFDYDELLFDGNPIRAVEPIASYNNIREDIIAFKEQYCGVTQDAQN